MYTKDERFLIALYEEFLQNPSEKTPLPKYVIGAKVGLQKRAVNAISHLLIRANFIKKQGDEDVILTPHGIQLAQTLLEKQ